LVNQYGGYLNAGGDLKETGTTHWLSPNTGATNSSGWTGLPGGLRNPNGTYFNLGYQGIHWMNYNPPPPYYFTLNYNGVNTGFLES
jgi:hypothetical protein